MAQAAADVQPFRDCFVRVRSVTLEFFGMGRHMSLLPVCWRRMAASMVSDESDIIGSGFCGMIFAYSNRVISKGWGFDSGRGGWYWRWVKLLLFGWCLKKCNKGQQLAGCWQRSQWSWRVEVNFIFTLFCR